MDKGKGRGRDRDTISTILPNISSNACISKHPPPLIMIIVTTVEIRATESLHPTIHITMRSPDPAPHRGPLKGRVGVPSRHYPLFQPLLPDDSFHQLLATTK